VACSTGNAGTLMTCFCLDRPPYLFQPLAPTPERSEWGVNSIEASALSAPRTMTRTEVDEAATPSFYSMHEDAPPLLPTDIPALRLAVAYKLLRNARTSEESKRLSRCVLRGQRKKGI
jgi:hypothetical protein